MEIVTRAISTLTPWANNPRTHNDQQIALIVASIQEFGFTNPVLIDENNTIIAGHGRTEAADLAGMEEVPCIVLEGLSDAQKRAYLIADNKLTLKGDWNVDMLKTEVENLVEDGFDIELTGFSEWELARLFEENEHDPDDSEDNNRNDGGGGSPVISTTIVFDDEGQKDAWYNFVRSLKDAYPDEETTGARIGRWCQDNGYA